MNALNFSQLSIPFLVFLFLVTASIIGYVGYYLTSYADQLADKTGFGEAAVGAVLLGAVTSLSGTVTSVVAAYQNYAALAVSNSIGGIVAQTAFLAIADITYRKANLEHAAASISNIMYGMILLILLMELIFFSVTPVITIWSFHPGMLLIVVTYILGLKMVSDTKKAPMWNPQKTDKTVPDIPDNENKQQSLPPLLLKFTASAFIVAVCGYIIAQAGIAISVKTELDASFVGALFTAVSTSLPELIVTLTAVQQGALTLAVGNIIGGNTFDILMVPLADAFYRQGSILHDSSSGSLIIMVLAGFITCVLLLGMLDREKEGIGNIGWESVTVLLAFFVGYTILYLN
ncbi:MAG: hypothetical protein WD604_17750 [Balneolaceae bacterium]